MAMPTKRTRTYSRSDNTTPTPKDKKFPIVDTKAYPLIVIFNQQHFTNYGFRYGSKKDVQELITTFKYLNIPISESNIHIDKTYKQVIAVISDLCNHSGEVSSIIVIVMSHGTFDNRVVLNDAEINAEEIFGPICRSKKFRDLPKIFIFQACKGENKNTVSPKVQIPSDLVSDRTLSSEYYPEALMIYSTLEGQVSYRHPDDGTWFIQEFCRNALMFGHLEHIVCIIQRTIKCVALRYESVEETVCKQLPIFISTLSSDYFIVESEFRKHVTAHEERMKAIDIYLENVVERISKI